MRGTLAANQEAGILDGLIPTYAGNTARRVLRKEHGGAHPHVCGEHRFAVILGFRFRGSSPRMRGTRGSQILANHQQGLIPTYAGNTDTAYILHSTYRAHPHVCGEHSGGHYQAQTCEGSSPRMRGTPSAWITPPGSGGLIPTYAGNTDALPSGLDPLRAHPHVCGEHIIQI